jgi:hypothetical protein
MDNEIKTSLRRSVTTAAIQLFLAIPAHFSIIPATFTVIPVPFTVIPAQAGIWIPVQARDD